MSAITISELHPSYLTEMEANEVKSVIGGIIGEILDSNGEGGFGVPNMATGIVFTPVGGNLANLQETLAQAIGYGGFNGFVSEVIHGGSFGFLAYKPTFGTFDQLM